MGCVVLYSLYETEYSRESELFEDLVKVQAFWAAKVGINTFNTSLMVVSINNF